MLQIFLIGSISGISYFMIECSKKNKNVRNNKKEESVKEKEAQIKIYRNEKTNLISPETYAELVKQLDLEYMNCLCVSRREFDSYQFRKNLKFASFDAFDANPTLNRYAELKCRDSSRVVLENRKNDYINASWVVCDHKEYRGKNILTQGPLNHTSPDFWAMIYQEKVEYIVMFCSFIEKGVEQCAQYYPTKEGIEKYDNFEVKYVDKEKDPVEGVTWTVLHLINNTGNDTKPRTINHIYVSWWPENTAPKNPKLTVELYQWLMKKNETHIPMVFHCNNGIGRSATFMAIYFFTRIDISTWKETRCKYEMHNIFLEALHYFRYGAIETPLQYSFFICCLFELFIQEGRIERSQDIRELMGHYKNYARHVREMVKAGKEVTIENTKKPQPTTSCYELSEFSLDE
ncbi:unnamed protein product [Caenorhabditis angaria]|uniref:Tyrosine-protein phosphatase domain-containing protein n=1 Tax=Caenorhabditis angaria TaxID=860376 RepID=A0A9P1IQL5_9PELO|nr:unnamed protein product [Caenorhabditis angaria]